MHRYADAVARSSAVVLSGSLPPGVPDSAYADLIGLAAGAGVPSLLDTSGPALVAGVAAGPAIVKPNLAELAAAVGSELPRPAARQSEQCADVLQAAGQLRAAGAGAVVVTLGADGLLALTEGGCWHAVSPRSAAIRPAPATLRRLALALGLSAGSPWPAGAGRGGIGAAAVAAPVAGEYDAVVYRQALAAVRVSNWEES